MKWQDFIDVTKWIEKKFEDGEWSVDPNQGFLGCVKHQNNFDMDKNEICMECWHEAGNE